MIEVKNLCFAYENSESNALDGINLKINKGELLAIAGHNGSGKSTLAKHLNGLLLPTSGCVLVEGMDTSDESCLLKIRQRVGMVFQNPDNQLVTTIVEEDVAFGPESLGVDPIEIRRRVDDCLKSVNMLCHAKSAPHMLSGGQKQRVAIAGMLAMRPDVLVMDESTSMLDPKGAKEVWDVIKKLNEKHNMTVIVITQQMEEAALCDRMAVLCNGRLLDIDTPRNIFNNDDLLKKAGLEAPAMVEIKKALIKGGKALKGDPLSLDEMVDSLLKYASEKGK